MLMPCSQDNVPILYDDTQNIRKLSRIEAIAIGNGHLRFQPNLGIAAPALHVHVWRLARRAFIREKEVSQTTVAEDNRHLAVLSERSLPQRHPTVCSGVLYCCAKIGQTSPKIAAISRNQGWTRMTETEDEADV